MLKRLNLFFLILALAFTSITSFTIDSQAQTFPEDHPAKDESFIQFFARITRGGGFPGIRLNPPISFQEAFKKSFLRGPWVGAVDKARRQITNAGGNVWQDYYHSENVYRLQLSSPEMENIFVAIYDRERTRYEPCLQSDCRPAIDLKNSPFSKWNVSERQLWTWVNVSQAPIYGGRTLVDFLGLQYKISATRALQKFDFKLLNTAQFKEACRQIGYEGEIYFRGITGLDPKDPSRRWILMNDDLMRKYTPFDSPLLQLLEYSGILVHEISHVYQDLEAADHGFDLEIRSAEGAMLIEGMAEYLAERSLRQASQELPLTAPQALGLFMAEAGLEVITRPGQESSGNLFPYTVGLPFAAAVFNESKNEDLLRINIYKTILGQSNLADFLNNL